MMKPIRRRKRQRSETGPSQQKITKILQPLANVPTYELLNEEKVALVHEKSMEILEQGGIAFLYDEAQEILKAHGVRVENNVAYFDRELVADYLAKAPSQFVWSAPNPDNDVKMGGQHVCFAPVVGPPFVTDLKRGRRESTHDDLINFLKMTQMTPYLHTSGAEIVVSSDIPIAYRHLELMYAHFKYTDKAMMGVYHTGMIARDTLNMAKVVYGEEGLLAKHYLHCVVNVSSPRRLDDRMLSLLIEYAQHNQIVDVTPFILSGAMGPVSILGTVAQLNAEALAGIVFAQMVNSGTPCVYGSFQAVVDLQSGAPVFGAPESQLALFISGQMARHYGLPFRAAGSYASSKIIDAQGAYESVMAMFPSMLTQPNFVLHAAGWLESGLTAGYEKFVLDCEMLGMYYTYLKGLDWDDDQWAMDAIINEVEPGGHHLGTAHTMRHYKTAFYRASLFDYDSGEAWIANGKEDSMLRANRKVKEILASYEQPALDAAIDDRLREYIERRKPELNPSMIVG